MTILTSLSDSNLASIHFKTKSESSENKFQYRYLKRFDQKSRKTAGRLDPRIGKRFEIGNYKNGHFKWSNSQKTEPERHQPGRLMGSKILLSEFCSLELTCWKGLVNLLSIQN